MINTMKNNLLTSVLILGMIVLYSLPAKSQDLDALLEKEAKPETTYATATFKSTRIVNGHSVQQMKKKQLEFSFTPFWRIEHRFLQFLGTRSRYNSFGIGVWHN